MNRHLMASIAPLALLAFVAGPSAAVAQSWEDFGALADSTVTNTGSSVVSGHVGVSTNPLNDKIVGFFPDGPGIIVAPYARQGQTVSQGAQSELDGFLVGEFAGLVAADLTPTNLTGENLGNRTLTAGVYEYDNDVTALLNGQLTLNAEGNPDAVFIFLIGRDLTTGADSSILLTNGASGANIFFVVGTAATLGAGTDFWGRIIARTEAITLGAGATISCGAALSQTAAVTLISNVIFVPGSSGCAVVAGDVEDELDEDAGDNASAIAEAIDDFIAGGGVLPDGFIDGLADLTPDELAEALSQLSGEAATATAPSGMQAMDSFLNMVMAPGLNRSPATPLQEPRDTVRVLGYGPETAPAAGAPFSSLDQPPLGAASDPRLWEIWAGVYGGYRDNDGDDGAGTHDRSSSHGGIAVGIDRLVAQDTKIGLAVGGGRTDFDVASNRGDGGSDMLQVAIYARTDIDRAYVSGAVAYAYHDVSIDRRIDVGTDSHFSSDFDAHNVAGHIEAGYRFGWVVPYAALRAQAYFTPSYDEDTESGVSTYALSYDENTTTVIRTELGARVEHTIALSEETALSLRGRAAWAHDTWSDTDVDAEFQDPPGLAFTVEGAEPAENLLLLSAGAELAFANGISVGLAVDTELAEESQTYTGTGRVRYRW